MLVDNTYLHSCGWSTMDTDICEVGYCPEFEVEAWERMTWGGVVVVNEPEMAHENMCPLFIEPYPRRLYSAPRG